MLISCTKTWCSGVTKQVLITCLINSVYLCLGLCRGYSSFLIIQLKADDSPMRLTVEEESWIATLAMLPNPLGSILSGNLMDIIGRKFSVMLLFPIFLVGWSIIAFATNVYMLYVGMCIQGLASGMTCCNSMYVAEISTPRYRGFLLAFTTVMFTFGVLLCNALLYAINWKTSATIFCSGCFVLFLIFTPLPESPSWLIGQNRLEEAREVLNWLRDGGEQEVKKELEDLIQRRDYASTDSVDYSNRKKSAEISVGKTMRIIVGGWKQLGLVSILWLSQQSTGYVPSITYTASIFEQLNVPIDVSIASLSYIGILFLSTLVSLPIHYHFRRRPTLMIGAVCCLICYSSAAAYETVFYHSSDKPYFWILPTFVYLGLICSIPSMVTIPFIMCGEIFPIEGRGILMGISGAMGYFYSTIVVKIFLYCLYRFGIAYIFWSYSLGCVIVIAFAYFVLPETKGKTLSQIQERYFRSNNKQAESKNNILFDAATSRY